MSSASQPIDKFPTVWLTYRQRIKLDLANVHGADEDDGFFNDGYLAEISTQEKQLADWVIKLFALQAALTAFQVIGFITPDGTISILGVTLKQAAGVKELILALSATVAVMTWLVLISRETCQTIIDTLLELNVAADFLPYAKAAGQTPFNLKLLFPRLHDQWVFATRFNKAGLMILTLLGLVLFLSFFGFMLAANIVFFRDIYSHPTLGVWSTLVLTYVGLVGVFGCLFLVRFYVPQPYSDSRILKQIEALKDVDEKLYFRLLQEVYGQNSRYRKKKRNWLSWFRTKK